MTAGQMRKIWATAKEQGLDKDLVYAMAKEVSGKDSLKTLTVAEGAMLIDRMLKKPSQSRYRASEAQVGMIRGLARDLGWDDPDRLRGWIKSRWGVEIPEWMNSRQARQCIEAMKAMLRGGRGERKKA